MSFGTCAICDSKAAKKKSESPIFSLDSIFYLGTRYHEMDFIYALNKHDEDAPYMIAQVLSFLQDGLSQTIQVQIRQLKHYNDLVEHDIASLNLANWRKDEVCNNISLVHFLIQS